ncbi:uncharacterized protein LOC117343181 [Pecten maximus]|uniref:uncharacterized protein LOC117343181 n=1 Tax=Pecten maximus TaxID=6579 RepID=UPI001458CEE9|nr:uncharacterized protein LOC117343181 [Pecten maximus]
MEPDENVFGHPLECQTWGPRVKSITLTVTVDRPLRKNEEVVLRPATKGGSIIEVDVRNKDGVKSTVIKMSITLKPDGINYFAIASREKTEVFQVSNRAVSLKPESEPEAEIDIPADAFESCELFVKFADTTDFIEENEQDEKDEGTSGKAVVMTNILDITTSDQQQPNKEIEIKMPITAKAQSEGIVILMTSNPDPNLLKWEWEEIPAEIKNGRVEFKIRHFSKYAGTLKTAFDADPEATENVTRKIFLKMRKVEFSVAVKTPEMDETKTDMIITCGTKRVIKTVKKGYDKSYTLFGLGHEKNKLEVPVGQIFRIEIRGNLKERNDDDNMELIFKGDNQESSRALEIVSASPETVELKGEVNIFMETEFLVSDVVETVDVGCFFSRHSKAATRVKSEIWETKTELLCTMPFDIKLIKREPEPEPAELPPSEPENTENTASDLGQPPSYFPWVKLKQVVNKLSDEQVILLGYQLGLSETQTKQAVHNTTEGMDLSRNILYAWYATAKKEEAKTQLMGALEEIGRQDLIQMLQDEMSVTL